MEEGQAPPYVVVDCMGVFAPTGPSAGKPWPVAGVQSASKDKTLLRKGSVKCGNTAEWDLPHASSQVGLGLGLWLGLGLPYCARGACGAAT